jgi:hypothetical protein
MVADQGRWTRTTIPLTVCEISKPIAGLAELSCVATGLSGVIVVVSVPFES